MAIDKLDKIGLDIVNAELKEKGISDEAIAKLQPIILLSGSNEEKLATLKEVLAVSETGLKGVEESEFILSTLKNLGLKNEIELELLYRCHLRSKGAGCANRQYYWWRTL